MEGVDTPFPRDLEPDLANPHLGCRWIKVVQPLAKSLRGDGEWRGGSSRIDWDYLLVN